MENLENNVMYRQYIHSSYCKTHAGDVVLVKEALRDKDNNISRNLRVITNPKRSYYITKPEFRNYKQKREMEPLDRLDKITCYNFNLYNDISRRLNLYGVNPRNINNNQYLYGSDINIKNIIKMHYTDNVKGNNIFL